MTVSLGMTVQSRLILESSHLFENSDYFHTGQHINWPHDSERSCRRAEHPKLENESLRANLSIHWPERRSQGLHIGYYSVWLFALAFFRGEVPKSMHQYQAGEMSASTNIRPKCQLKIHFPCEFIFVHECKPI